MASADTDLAGLLRAMLADVAAVDPAHVAILDVSTVVTPAGTNASYVADTLAVNASHPINNGTAVSAFVFGNLTASSARRRVLSAAVPGSAPACVAARARNRTVSTASSTVRFAIDVVGWSAAVGNGSDIADAVVARLRALRNVSSLTASAPVADFVSAWANCTGAVGGADALVQVQQEPAVVYAPRVPLAPPAQPTAADSDGGLTPGGIAGVIIAALVAASCCLCFVLFARRRSRKDVADRQGPSVPAASPHGEDGLPFTHVNPVAPPLGRAAGGEAGGADQGRGALKIRKVAVDVHVHDAEADVARAAFAPQAAV